MLGVQLELAVLPLPAKIRVGRSLFTVRNVCLLFDVVICSVDDEIFRFMWTSPVLVLVSSLNSSTSWLAFPRGG